MAEGRAAVVVQFAPPIEGWDENNRDAVVWVDVDRLFDAWRGGLSFRPVPARYASVGRWIVGGVHPVDLPHLAFDDGEIDFSDGRHRFSWARDHGAKAMPVTIDPARAADLEGIAGTSLRVCQVTIPQ